MVHRRRWRPSTVNMTGLAKIAGIDMRGIFTRRDNTIVATDTGTIHLIVIHPGDYRPAGQAVTGLTNIGAIDMGCRLAARINPIVAASAIIHDTGMIKYRTSPIHSGMTNIT